MKMFIFILSLLPFISQGDTLSDPEPPIKAPPNCHLLKYKSKVIIGGNVNRYIDSINENYKADILCIGETIDVNKPIYSNGGDVIIWASTVKINAPIDTRVHFNHAAIDYFQNGTTNLSKPGDVYPADVRLKSHPREDDRYMRSFVEYYTGCIDCVKLASDIWIPRAPSGLVPGLPINGKVDDGLKTFDDDLDFDSLKSGNVYIISANFEVSPNFYTPNPPPDLPVCNAPEKTNYIPYAVNAGGMTGGRGGAGTPSTCTNYLKKNFDCLNYLFLESGKSGPGGNGGGGGSINWIKIGSSWDSGTISTLRVMSSVAGGFPGESKQYYSPSARGNFAATGNFCDFRRRSAGNLPESKSGASGVLNFSSMDAGKALELVGQLTLAKDARFDYDFSELAKRAWTDTGISNVTFDDYLVSRLSDFLGRAEVNTLESLRSVFFNDEQPMSSFVPAHLQPLKIEHISMSSFSERAKILLRQLSNFSPQDKSNNALSSYLISSGGLLNVSDWNPQAAFTSQALRIDIATQTKTLSNLQVELKAIGNTLAEIDIREEKNGRAIGILKLKQDADAIESSIQQSGLVRLSELGQAVSRVGASAIKVYASYQTSNPPALVESMAGLASSMDQLKSYLNSSNDNDLRLRELRDKLKMLQLEYESFLISISKTRRANNDSKIAALASTLQARSNLAGKVEGRHAQFNNLLGASFASYVNNPTLAAKNKFENNLDGLRVFVESYPSKEPGFDVGTTDLSCGDKPWAASLFKKYWRCTDVNSLSYPQLIIYPYTLSSGVTVDIPLYTLSSNNGGRFVTFRLPVEVRALNGENIMP